VDENRSEVNDSKASPMSRAARWIGEQGHSQSYLDTHANPGDKLTVIPALVSF
jgi:hypothetical protein